MRILIEGQTYPTEALEKVFDDPKFYSQDVQKGTITSVGYYHSFTKGELIYMLPKVFMADENQTVFGADKDILFNLNTTRSFKHKKRYEWIRHITVYFYNSLIEYKRRKRANSLNKSATLELNTNIGKNEYSYLDLLLSFVNFFNKNKQTVHHRFIELQSKQIKNTKWSKTVRKTLPLVNDSGQPVYHQYQNKRKIVNYEEELFTYFFSILNHFNETHSLNLRLNPNYKILKGKKFEALKKSGLSKLRKIKYRYFRDTFKKMYRLCEIYFSRTDKSSTKRRREEYISVDNYNLVFEDMVDKLFSDPIKERETEDGISLTNLKYHEDGKIIDHLFDHNSLLDTSDIFYIGDSKYYKSGSTAGKMSKYKQFTYAKNVIQYNIDLLNEGQSYLPNIRYRDELTEGYNITPNFFIYGSIFNFKNFDTVGLEERGEIKKSYHFKYRLFDRDTLFVHQYNINFLFVLKAYSLFSNTRVKKFREKAKKKFRDNFIKFFSNENKSGYNFYKYTQEDVKRFVNENFRLLLGKCYKTNEGNLIIAIHHEDDSLKELMDNLQEYKFS